MTHPFAEFAAATALVVAIGAGALAVLPQEEHAEPVAIALRPPQAETRRAEPLEPPTDAERIEALQHDLAAIAAEQKRITQSLKTALRERRQR
jgi:hypothetical protein